MTTTNDFNFSTVFDQATVSRDSMRLILGLPSRDECGHNPQARVQANSKTGTSFGAAKRITRKDIWLSLDQVGDCWLADERNSAAVASNRFIRLEQEAALQEAYLSDDDLMRYANIPTELRANLAQKLRAIGFWLPSELEPTAWNPLQGFRFLAVRHRLGGKTLAETAVLVASREASVQKWLREYRDMADLMTQGLTDHEIAEELNADFHLVRVTRAFSAEVLNSSRQTCGDRPQG